MKQQHSDYYKQVLQYCDDIKTGKILSCIWVKKAVKRFLNDLKREKEEGWQFRFDEDKFVEVVEFAENLLPIFIDNFVSESYLSKSSVIEIFPSSL